MIKLAQGKLTEGDGGPGYLAITLLNLDELVPDHPMKVDGLLTAGYTIYFFIKQVPGGDDSNAIVTKSSQSGGGLTITGKTTALIDFYPANSTAIKTAIASSGSSKVWYKTVAEKSPNERYTLEASWFTLVDV